MFARAIEVDEVKAACLHGEIIESYADDKPFPSFLVLATVKGKAIHVVVAQDQDSRACIVVTTYIPDLKIWENNFKTRKKR
jgi:hypothetical protein